MKRVGASKPDGSGDASSAAVFQPYRDRIHSSTLRLILVPAEADDLVQETFLGVHRKLIFLPLGRSPARRSRPEGLAFRSGTPGMGIRAGEDPDQTEGMGP